MPVEVLAIVHLTIGYMTSSSAIAESPRCRVGCLVMAKSGRLELEDTICGHYRSSVFIYSFIFI